MSPKIAVEYLLQLGLDTFVATARFVIAEEIARLDPESLQRLSGEFQPQISPLGEISGRRAHDDPNFFKDHTTSANLANRATATEANSIKQDDMQDQVTPDLWGNLGVHLNEANSTYYKYVAICTIVTLLFIVVRLYLSRQYLWLSVLGLFCIGEVFLSSPNEVRNSFRTSFDCKRYCSALNILLICFCALLREKNYFLHMVSGIAMSASYLCYCLTTSHRVHLPLLVLTPAIASLNGSSHGTIQEIASSAFPYPSYSAILMLMPLLTKSCTGRHLWMMFGAFFIWWFLYVTPQDEALTMTFIELLCPIWLIYCMFFGGGKLGVRSTRSIETMDKQFKQLHLWSKTFKTDGVCYFVHSKTPTNYLMIPGHVFGILALAVFALCLGFKYVQIVFLVEQGWWVFDRSVGILLLGYLLVLICWNWSGRDVARESRFVARCGVLLLSSVLIEHLVLSAPNPTNIPDDISTRDNQEDLIVNIADYAERASTFIVFLSVLILELILWSVTLSGTYTCDDVRIFHLFIACYNHATRQVTNAHVESAQVLMLTICILDVRSGDGLLHHHQYLIAFCHISLTALQWYSGISLAHKVAMTFLVIPLFPRKVFS